jgi:glycine oxidase
MPEQTNNALKRTTIIGWGLAGATLAWQFYFAKKSFSIYDSGINHSTRTAAGLVNPIVFKRLGQSWNVNTLMPYAEIFYSKIEEILTVKLLSRKNIYSVFSSVQDENNWSVKQGDDRYKNFLGHSEFESIDCVQMPFGLGKVNTFGNIDTNLFLDASKDFFSKNQIPFFNTAFDYENVLANQNQSYIFCEGFDVVKNPYFNYLPLKPSHGEILIIETDELKFDAVLSKNMFVVPHGNNQYKIGSTYNWDLKEPITTELGKTEIIEKFENFVDCNYKIISHQAGIRPTVSDRKPLLGTHPTQKNAHIFNGLGTKGVMIAPYYGEQLLRYLFEGKLLDKEVDVARYTNQ